MTRRTHIPERVRNAAGVRLLLVLALWGTVTTPREARAQSPSKEYQVKAACLLNFAQFIQWPPAAFSDPGSPVIVGVFGEDPFGAALEQTFKDESIQGRALVVKRSRQIDDLKTCHLLFISKSEKDRVTEILSSLNNASVVTIGEIDGFAARGGIINFYLDSNKVRFEINVDAAEHKGIKVSSQLLKRAKIVGPNSGRSRE
jgi:hypothetical protein